VCAFRHRGELSRRPGNPAGVSPDHASDRGRQEGDRLVRIGIDCLERYRLAAFGNEALTKVF
jgi:hypothetical protein